MEGIDKPKKDPAELLRQGGFAVIEGPSTETFSGSPQLPGIDTPELQEALDEAAEACTRYLAGEIITDTYPDHKTRRTAREGAIAQTYGEAFAAAFEANRLRLNNISNVLYSLRYLVRTLETQQVRTPEADQVREIFAHLPSFSGYDALSTDEKVMLVQTLSGSARALLHLVYTPH